MMHRIASSFRTVFRSLPLALALGGFVAALPLDFKAPLTIKPAAAQKDEKKGPPRRTKKVPALRQKVFEEIAKAQQIADEEKDYVEAVRILDKLREKGKLNAYEAAVTWNLYAYIRFEQDDMPGAIEAYKNVLAQENIPESLQLSTVFGLAQLHFATEKYQESLRYLLQWFDMTPTPGPVQYVFLAQNYYTLEQFEKTIEPLNKAIELAKAQGIQVKENWYLLLRSSYFELNNYPKVLEILEILVVNFPKPEYWIQMAGLYGELGQEKKQLSTMEVAYKQGFLDDKEQRLINMAQLYLYHEVPIKAAWVMERGFEDELIEANADNYELYGQALVNAQEITKAIEPLRKSAEMSGDGEQWFRLGQVYLDREEWDKAITALDKASDLDGTERRDLAFLLSGTAHVQKEEFADARKALREARKVAKDKSTREQIDQWTAYVTSEERRVQALAEARGL